MVSNRVSLEWSTVSEIAGLCRLRRLYAILASSCLAAIVHVHVCVDLIHVARQILPLTYLLALIYAQAAAFPQRAVLPARFQFAADGRGGSARLAVEPPGWPLRLASVVAPRRPSPALTLLDLVLLRGPQHETAAKGGLYA